MQGTLYRNNTTIYLRVPFMAKTGLAVNLAGVILVTAVTYLIALPTLGISTDRLPTWAVSPSADAVDSRPVD